MNEAGHGSLFWITSVGLLLTFRGLPLESADVTMSGVSSAYRDVTADTQDVELGVPDFTTRRPWFETEMTIGFRPRRGRNSTLNLIFFFEKE